LAAVGVVLSIVDNRELKRLFYQVLDHDPTPEEVVTFFQQFRVILDARRLLVRAITTDGSGLCPAAITAVFGPIPNQVCQFHVLHQLNEAELHAVASIRKKLAAQQPKLPHGRPPKRLAHLVRQRARLEDKIRNLYTYPICLSSVG
jgi:hypothetical protein